MDFEFGRFFRLMLSIVVISSFVHSKSLETMEYTLNLIREGEETIKLGHDNIVLLLGNTGSGKSTLAQLLTTDGSRLFSKEVGVDTSEYIIEDLDEKISFNSTLVSQTIFPELLVEPVSNDAYYDCPGFSDTRNSSIDISATYFIHRVIDAAKSIKNVFVVNYSSVKAGVDRSDFLKLLRHAATFFKNFDKFKDGTVLIVTKVDNTFIKKGKEYVLLSDEKILTNIAEFLQQGKASLLDLIKEETDQKKTLIYTNALKLVDILLVKENDNYPRIGLFRRPDEAGSLDKISQVQDGKQKLLNILQKINYDAKLPEDFGYTVSDESINDVAYLVESIAEHINDDISRVGQDVKESYYSVENVFSDVYDLKDYFRSIYDEISLMIKDMNLLKKPGQLVSTLKTTLSKLKLPINEESLKRITRFDSFLNFLADICNKELILSPLEWIKSFETSLKYLEDSRNIYTFIIDFYLKLSEWSIQKNPNQFNVNGLKEQVSDLQKQNKDITGSTIKNFLDEIYYEEIGQGFSIRGFDGIKNAIFDERKFKIIYDLLNITLNSPVEITCENNNKRIAKGEYVKLSTVLHSDVCSEKVLRNEIYAVNKIFIDEDLVDVGQQLKAVLMAPIWEVVDGKQINLIGDSGVAFPELKAAIGLDGSAGSVDGAPGNRGTDGLPGVKGYPGGSIFGVTANIINGQNLAIKSTGGNGGPAQDGGDGGNGENGKDVGWIVTGTKGGGNIITDIEYTTWEQKGGVGGAGGNGGNGGLGGVPGVSSEIQILSFSETITSKIEPISGNRGKNGIGGIHGIGATSGNKCTGSSVETTYLGIWSKDTDMENISCHKEKSGDGVNGDEGTYDIGIEGPETAVILEGKKLNVEIFKNLLLSQVDNNYKINYLTRFINIFQNDDNIKNIA